MPRKMVLLIAVAAFLVGIDVDARQGVESFDVASVKPNNDPGGFGVSTRPGLVKFTNVQLREVIANAYGFGFSPNSPLFQAEAKIMGGDPKLLAMRFDIVATFPQAVGTSRVPDMLKNLLRARFGLRAHFETLRGRVYELRVARSDGGLGPQFKVSKYDCLSYQKNGGRADAPDSPRDANGRSWCWPPLESSERMRRAASGP